jgi:hypothetical protein
MHPVPHLEHRPYAADRAARQSCETPVSAHLRDNVHSTTSGVFHPPEMLLTMSTMGCDRILFSVDLEPQSPSPKARIAIKKRIGVLLT